MSGVLEALGISPADVNLLRDRNVPLDQPMPYDPSLQVPGSPPAQRVGDVAGGVLQTLPSVGDAYSVLQAIADLEAGNYGNAALNGMGALPMIAGMGTFAGVGAKTADLMKLERANKMLADGIDPAKIWHETGWTNQFPDGKWRFEIPDEASAIKDLPSSQSWETFAREAEAEKYGRRGADVQGMTRKEYSAYQKWRSALSDQWKEATEAERPLTSVLEHSQAQAAYPGLYGSLNTFHDPSLGTSGSFQDGLISYGNTNNVEGVRSLLSHELQHALQEQEGFAKGGASRMAFQDPRMWGGTETPAHKAAYGILQEKLAEISKPMPLDEYAKKAWGTEEITDEIRKDYAGYLKVQKNSSKDPMIQKAAQETAAREWYQRLAGEAEARLVQKRLNYTPEQRQQIPPWTEFDVPVDRQIVR